LSASKPERILKGNGVSPGVALGQALKLDSHNRVILKLLIQQSQVEDEVARMYEAIRVSREQLETLRARLEEKVGREHSFILDVHLLMLEDRTLVEEIVDLIRRYRANAEWAVREATDRIRQAYASLDDEYFRERWADVENVIERVLLNLSGDKATTWAPLPEDLVVVSHDFNASAFAAMDIHKVRGLALEAGGRTSHTAIIARSLRIPAVMEARGCLAAIGSGDLVLINGDEGYLVINPTAERLDALRDRLADSGALREPAVELKEGAFTRDGASICLQANTELPSEVRVAKSYGAEGIGLFRSEFLFFGHPNGFPTMGDQLETYALLAREMSPYPVAIRTLDVGADKVAGTGAEPQSDLNPSMGLRGIRLGLLARDQLLAPQLEAILRASSEGKVEIVLPMVSSVEEIWDVRAAIDKIRARLWAEPEASSRAVPLGAMIEIPAAVLSLESIAGAVDFLCVGTNDLIQYLLAVDRSNPQVSHLFQPLHPSVLNCLDRIASLAGRLGKPVRVCGEMSSNPFFAVLLLGIGFRQFSMNCLSIPIIRNVISRVTLEDCRRIAAQAIRCVTAREAGELLISSVSALVEMDLSSYVSEVCGPGATVA
jgi:phosphoenolpyruvate-protein phosphotransferase (PTS system enzyme I)